MWQKLIAWSQNSLTHLWANTVSVGMAVFGGVSYFASEIFPDVKDQIQQLVPSQWWPWIVVGIMIVTKMARNRSVNPLGEPH